MTPRQSVVTLAIALAAVLTACDAEEAPEGEAAPAEAATEIEVVDNSFSPETVEVAAGDTIRWTHEGQAAHTVTFEDGPDSGTIDSGDTFSHTFDEPGEYAYVCSIHPGMEGTVVVEG